MLNPELQKVVHKLEHFCAYQERSLQEVEKKLANFQISSAEKQQVIALLKQNKFLDESRYLTAFVKDKFNLRRWGKIRISIELKRKGYKESEIAEVFEEELSDEAYNKALLTVLKIKNRSLHEEDIYKRKQKLAKFALSRGFEMFLIWPAIDKLNLGGDFEEGSSAFDNDFSYENDF